VGDAAVQNDQITGSDGASGPRWIGFIERLRAAAFKNNTVAETLESSGHHFSM
jgi:hypothetical protein